MCVSKRSTTAVTHLEPPYLDCSAVKLTDSNLHPPTRRMFIIIPKKFIAPFKTVTIIHSLIVDARLTYIGYIHASG